MRRVRYSVAMSLDGYIAGANGEADWIVIDPEMNFSELWAQFDIGLMGRRTYEAAVARLGPFPTGGMKVVVASRTMKPDDHPGITIVPDLTKAVMRELRGQVSPEQGSKDIWLFGGGEIFSHLLNLQEVDTVEVATIPVLLSGGVPMLGRFDRRVQLTLQDHRLYPSGVVWLAYGVQHRLAHGVQRRVE